MWEYGFVTGAIKQYVVVKSEQYWHILQMGLRELSYK